MLIKTTSDKIIIALSLPYSTIYSICVSTALFSLGSVNHVTLPGLKYNHYRRSTNLCY